jgi:N-acetyl-gamma-glutamyl-phosphate reductase
MGQRVSVAGASGYAGGELLRLLLGHPEFELAAICAGSSAGAPVTDLHPHLVELAGASFAATDAETLGDADLTFLALPHGESSALAAQLVGGGTTVIDLGADHRLADPAAWDRWYGGPHAGAWPYGLPELPGARAAISGSDRVAVPGCYPTSVELALAPLLNAGLVDPDDLVVVASSGTSGAGRAAKATLLGSEVMGDLTAYKVAGHQHTPEIVQALSAAAGTTVSLSFTTVLAPMPRGILATSTAKLKAGVRAGDLRAAMLAAYGDEPFVHLLAEGRWPHTAATVGSNSCQLQVTADLDAGRAIVVSALDNLGKGAAGQAVQCANLALGLPETTGLPINGVAP